MDIEWIKTIQMNYQSIPAHSVSITSPLLPHNWIVHLAYLDLWILSYRGTISLHNERVILFAYNNIHVQRKYQKNNKVNNQALECPLGPR